MKKTKTDRREESFEQWKEFDRQIEALLKDALWLAGMKHVVMQYADGGAPGELDIPRETAIDSLRGIAELLDDMRITSFPLIREKLRAYQRASGLTWRAKG